MSKQNKPSLADPITLAEAMRLQEIEANSLSVQDIARHERFNAKGLSVKQRIEALKEEMGQLSAQFAKDAAKKDDAT